MKRSGETRHVDLDGSIETLIDVSGMPTNLMRAIAQTDYGSADVLQMGVVERPRIGPDEVLVEVRAAGVDRAVWHGMTGLPYLGRLVFGVRVPKVAVPGFDVAGVVVEVRDDVTRFQPGGHRYYPDFCAAPSTTWVFGV